MCQWHSLCDGDESTLMAVARTAFRHFAAQVRLHSCVSFVHSNVFISDFSFIYGVTHASQDELRADGGLAPTEMSTVSHSLLSQAHLSNLPSANQTHPKTTNHCIHSTLTTTGSSYFFLFRSVVACIKKPGPGTF